MYAAYKNQKKFRGLDGLRCLSIAAVVWHHSVGSIPDLLFTRFGFLGVDLFFVISGFLIVTLLLRERENTGRIGLRHFYIRRSLRIFPLYYGFIFALVALYYVFRPDSVFGARFVSELPIYIFYLANIFPVVFSVTWSLAMEEQFYLVWPCIEKYFRKSVIPILLLALAVNQLINFNHAAIAQWLEVGNLNALESTFTPILLGVGLAHLLHNKSTYASVQHLLCGKHAAAVWLAALVFSTLLWPEDISGLPRLLIQTNMALLVGSVVASPNSSLTPILELKPIARIGVISYGIYLFHLHCIIVVEALLAKAGLQWPLLVFFAGFSLTILLAEISFRWYETPFLKLKSKFYGLASNTTSVNSPATTST